MQTLSEDKKELGQQRKRLEYADSVYNTHLGNIQSCADSEEDRINQKSADLQNKLDVLVEAMFQYDDTFMSVSVLKSSLLPDADVAQLQEKTEFKGQTDFFKSLQSSLSLQTDAVRASSTGEQQLDDALLFGDGYGALAPPPTSSVVSEAAFLQQVNKTKELSRKVEQLEALLRKFKDRPPQTASVGASNDSLTQEVQAVRDKNAFLLQEVAALQGVVKTVQGPRRHAEAELTNVL